MIRNQVSAPKDPQAVAGPSNELLRPKRTRKAPARWGDFVRLLNLVDK